jgi:hypothetical protein
MENGGMTMQVHKDDPAADIAACLLELGKDPSLFQFPHSSRTELIEIGSDKHLGVKPADPSATGDDHILSAIAPEGTKSWIVRTSAGIKGVVIRDDHNVWVNVANLEEGYGGSQIYDVAANYAINNHIRFIGDPAGVTHAAIRRRLEHMLSSAIKYGTTDHLLPHQSQLEGAIDAGIEPLNWTEGDTLANIRSMVAASMATTIAAEPAANLIEYEVQAQRFQSLDGAPIGAGDIARLLGQGGLRVSGPPGVTTVQRTALFRALLSGEDARRTVLDAVRGEQGARGAGLSGIFY